MNLQDLVKSLGSISPAEGGGALGGAAVLTALWRNRKAIAPILRAMASPARACARLTWRGVVVVSAVIAKHDCEHHLRELRAEWAAERERERAEREAIRRDLLDLSRTMVTQRGKRRARS